MGPTTVSSWPTQKRCGRRRRGGRHERPLPHLRSAAEIVAIVVCPTWLAAPPVRGRSRAMAKGFSSVSALRSLRKPHALSRVYHRPTGDQRCSVPGCIAPAVCTVALVDFYAPGTYGRQACWFFEQDQYCPYLCESHLSDNMYRGRQCGPRQASEYPWTNILCAAGWSEYLPLEAAMAGRRRSA
jgi:hypothetical protein